jgi:excisionase family DNA binding protein
MAAAFLTVPEVARLLRVGQRTVYSLARAGSLAGAVKVGNQWRVNRTALRQWAGALPIGGTQRTRSRRRRA